MGLRVVGGAACACVGGPGAGALSWALRWTGWSSRGSGGQEPPSQLRVTWWRHPEPVPQRRGSPRVGSKPELRAEPWLWGL